MQQMIKTIKGVMRGERGAVLPLVGLAFGVVVLASGFAIDYTRAQIVKERLQWAVDAGALAGAKMAVGGTLAQIRTEANAYFRANFPEGYMQTSGGQINVQQINPAGGQGEGLRFTVDGLKMDNLLFGIFGADQTQISALAEVNTLPIKPLDIVFSVDLSGSMQVVAGKGMPCVYLDESTGTYPANCYAGTSKLANAKTAMRNMLTQLHSGTDVRFGLVGWTTVVNGYNAFTGSNPSITCPDGSRWAGFASDNRLRVAMDNAASPGPFSTPCQEFTAGTIRGSGPVQPMRYLTNNRGTINNAISALRPDGNTDGSLGMLWAYNMFLNRGWAGWKTPAANKSIVLLTDGDNTKYFGNPSDLADPDVYGVQANNRQIQICNQAKNAGIAVYTIAYDMSNSIPSRVRAKNMLNSCASRLCPTNPGGVCFFDARDPSALYKAMETIGNTMMTMRLTR